jgi:hypothetical protein
MQQMNRALIDALAVSWWYDTKANGPNAILDLVFEKAVAHNLKITIDYEHGRAPLETVDHDLSYFLGRYKDHPAMLKVEGCPVMIWTAWGHTPAEWQGVFDRLEKAGIKAFPIMSGSYQNGKGRAYLGPFRALEEYTLVDIEDCQLADFMKTICGILMKQQDQGPEWQARPASCHDFTGLRRNAESGTQDGQRRLQRRRVERPDQIRRELPGRSRGSLLPRHLRRHPEIQS